MAIVGTSVTLRCTVRGGHEQSSIRWFREHYPMPENAIFNGDAVIIRNINVNDAGRYYCEVLGEAGTLSDFINVKVDCKHILIISLLLLYLSKILQSVM